MKEKSIPRHVPLTADEMRGSVGSGRLEIYNKDDKCFASFQCYDGSSVSCSGVKNSCNSVETGGYIIGVRCQGVVDMCNPAFPTNPSGSGSSGCKDLQRVACASLNHNDECSWTCDGETFHGVCKYNPMDFPVSKGLWCSDTGIGSRLN